MPSFEGRLDASRGIRLVAYVRSFAGLSASSIRRLSAILTCGSRK